ncbi:MAG TPA: sigma-70 family RNA polymerase sigma factor [Casimicrobiaceae bacterium]
MTEQTNVRRFADLVLPHLDSAYSLARWLTRNDDDAQDIVQEAYVRAFRSFAGFRGETARPWLLAIVRNTTYTWLAKQRKAEVEVPYDDEVHGDKDCACVESAPGPLDNPEAILARADDARLVDEALQRLPVGFREVVVLRDIEELSYKEIAEIANLPIGTVMSRLARGRKLLLGHLTQQRKEWV